MKNILFTITIFVLTACQVDKNGNSDTDQSRSDFKNDTTLTLKKIDCNCLTTTYKNNYQQPPTFYNEKNSDHAKTRNDAEWQKYSTDSVRLKVKYLSLNNYDTIPGKFKAFQNVEKVLIHSSRNGIKGLDNFPNLKEIEFFGSVIKLDSTDDWLKELEILKADKTKIEGLNSFKSIPNLVELQMGFSGFDRFPSDIESLTCLNRLELGAYTFGQIDLNKVDLRKFKCLKVATFTTWYKTLTGIPTGISDTTTHVTLVVDHDKLTKEEKKKANEYSARVKKASR